MRWSYKTVHFSLKKEGLLGSAFIDEDEIEVSLNDYGKLGWELVSFMEVNDGLIAVFKQPFGQGLPVLKEEAVNDSDVVAEHSPEGAPDTVQDVESIENVEPIPAKSIAMPSPVASSRVDVEEPSPISPMESIPGDTPDRSDATEDSDSDVGSIRIL